MMGPSGYFYRVHKIEQAESLRVKLVKRAISSEEEQLSWDEFYDDDDDDDTKVVKLNDKDGNPSGVAKCEGSQSNTVNTQTSSIAEVRDVGVAAAIAGGKVDADKEEGSVSSLVAGKHVVVDSVKESSIEGDANIEKGLDVIAKSSEKGSDRNANSTEKNDKKE